MMARTMSKWMVVGLVLALGTTVPAAADTLMHGRVSYESGGGMVKGTADSDWGYATVNALVLPGDTLWADSGALLEVEFNGGTFLRMADQSKADVVSLPPSAVFRAWSGSYYVHRVARSSGNVLFQSPSCQISVDRDSQVRIDVVETGATTVTVRWGRATIGTDKGQAVVASTAQRVYVDPGYLPSVPQAYDTSSEDDFDAWSRERARLVAMGDNALPSTYRTTSEPLGTADLANYGEWVTVDNTPYWRPTVIVDYVPYRHGIWSYTAGCGYVWVGDYPFSYVTSHYGRWCHNDRYGWMWSYSDVWAPAWVASVRCGPYFAWAPLDPFGRPVSYGAAVFNCGSFVLTMGSGSYCLADNLFYGYSYGRPVTSGIFNNISGNNVYVWNIYGNTVNVNYPWAGNLPVRDFKPQRVMRGPDTIATGSRVVRAADRASRLESNLGRATFTSNDRPGARGVRTNISARSHEARMREVGVEPARALEGSRTSERVATAANSSAGRATREARTLGSDTGVEPTRRDREASRDVETTRADRTPNVGGERNLDSVDRGGRGTRSISTDDTGNDNAPQRTARETDRVRGNAVEPRMERTAPQDSIRSERSMPSDGDRPQRTMTPSEGRGNRTSAVDGGAGVRSITRTPAEATMRSNPRVISLDGSNGSGRSMAERRSSTGVSSRMESPSRSQAVGPRVSERSMDAAPRSMERSMPSAPRSVERSMPSTPRSVERTAPPVRSYERSVAPQQRMSYPQQEAPRSRVITIPNSMPSRSATMSEPAPRRMEAPRAPMMQERAPVMQERAPVMQQRAVEAPRMEAPRMIEREAPRVQQMPQMQAPQRPDFGGGIDRGGMSGGSHGGGRGNSERSVGSRAR